MEPKAGTDEAPDATIPENQSFDERAELINKALRFLFETAIEADKREKAPDVVPILSAGLTLLGCGLMALTEIARAQTQLVAMAERDFAKEVEAMANDQAEVKATEIRESETKRGFIGQKA